MTTYNTEQILYFQARAERLKMSFPTKFMDFEPDWLITICNGVGGMGSRLSPLINWVYAKFQTSAAIHDVRYWIGGNEEDRLIADHEFLQNMLKEWADYWGWFRWLRPLARAERRQIQAAYLAVRSFGESYFGKEQAT